VFVFGENFDPGAVILVNREEQATTSEFDNPQTTLISKKAGKKVKAGDNLQVRNPNGVLSDVIFFPGPEDKKVATLPVVPFTPSVVS